MTGAWTVLRPGHSLPRRVLLAEPDRPLVEALLDQRGVSGLGNLWVVELCFLRGRSPWAPVGTVDLPPLLDLARRMLRHSLEHARPVPAGDPYAREVWWCPACQPR